MKVYYLLIKTGDYATIFALSDDFNALRQRAFDYARTVYKKGYTVCRDVDEELGIQETFDPGKQFDVMVGKRVLNDFNFIDTEIEALK